MQNLNEKYEIYQKRLAKKAGRLTSLMNDAKWLKLCEILEPFGFLIDCQVMNEHLKFMGAVNLARREFLARFNELKVQPSGFDEFGNLL